MENHLLEKCCKLFDMENGDTVSCVELDLTCRDKETFSSVAFFLKQENLFSHVRVCTHAGVFHFSGRPRPFTLKGFFQKLEKRFFLPPRRIAFHFENPSSTFEKKKKEDSSPAKCGTR